MDRGVGGNLAIVGGRGVSPELMVSAHASRVVKIPKRGTKGKEGGT